MRAVILLALLAGTASAQDALIGQPGCTLAWDFPAEEQSQVAAFPVWINGSWAYAAKPDQRSVPCADIGLVEPGTYALEIFARATPESARQNSVRVKRAIEIQPPKPTARVTAPANLRMP